MSVRLASTSRTLAARGMAKRRRRPHASMSCQSSCVWTKSSLLNTGLPGSGASSYKEVPLSLRSPTTVIPFAAALLSLPLIGAVAHNLEDSLTTMTWADHALDRLGQCFTSRPYVANGFSKGNETELLVEYSPVFPTLSASLVRPGQGDASDYQELRPNTPSPVPFETDLFKGHVSFLLRPDSAEHDPVYHDRVFGGAGDDKTEIFMQVQGRFKRKPRGTVYMGLELPGTEDVEERLFSGKVTRALSRVLLSIVRRIEPRVHYSYGSPTERPHIVAPIQSTVDHMVASSTSEAAAVDGIAPQLGFPVKVDDHEQDYSCSSWNTDNIYTFTFSNYHVSFPSWRLVNMPLGPETVSLRRFWGNENAVRLIAYEVEDGKDHHVDEISYMFCAEVETLLEGES